MRILFFVALAGLLVAAATCRADDWVLESSTITYHVVHPLHHVDGTSRAAKGKGVCRKGRCDFLAAVPVNTFDSGDSNRDLHMLQVTRGGEFPMVAVRTAFPEVSTGTTVAADLEIQFAGRTVAYKGVEFRRADVDGRSRIRGTIPLKISDFKIVAPSLLAVPIKDDVPVEVDATWKKAP
jgi:hypothetical protein